MRSIEPRVTGYATNPDDGVRTYYEVFGPEDAECTILFLPTWSLVYSRCRKMQPPYFARHGFQVITFDGRGNGKSGPPESGYTATHHVQDALAIIDAMAIDRVDLIDLSAGGRPARCPSAGALRRTVVGADSLRRGDFGRDRRAHAALAGASARVSRGGGWRGTPSCRENRGAIVAIRE